MRPRGVLAPVLGFVVFLLLLPARAEHLDIAYVDRAGESVQHCSTHLGWQDVLGPLSCSRWGAAAAGVVVALVALRLSRWRSRRKHEALTTGRYGAGSSGSGSSQR